MTDAAPIPDPNNAEIPPETPGDSAGQSSVAQGDVDALMAAAPGEGQAPSAEQAPSPGSAAGENPALGESPALAPESGAIAQAEIDALMNAAPSEAPAPATDTSTISQSELDALMAAPRSEAPAPAADINAIAQTEVDALAAEMSAAIAAEAAAASKGEAGTETPAAAPALPPADDAARFEAPELSESEAGGETSLDMLDDVQLDVKIELGRTHMYIEDVLKLGAGSVVELDKLAGDPVDIFVNERLIARGEVLVLNDNFCVRINAIHNPVSEIEVG